jgi:multidrug efflux system membrane fusion protein
LDTQDFIDKTQFDETLARRVTSLLFIVVILDQITDPTESKSLREMVKAPMSSAQLTEHESNAGLPASEPPKVSLSPEEPTGSSARKWIVILVVLLAVGGAIWKIRDNRTQQDAQSAKMAAMGDRAIPVMVQTVQQKTMPIYLTALGTVTAYNTVTIKSRVDGELLQVNVREGQAVRKGQLLALIDPKPYEAVVAQAQGALVRDQANAANASAEAARYTALYQAGVVSKESQQTQVSGAGQAQGSIAADEAAIQAAKVNLAYTRITSPIDGVVGLRQVDPGNIVHAADTTGLLVVTQLQPITVIFTLPEDQLPQVLELTRNGKRLAVEAYDRSQTTHLASGSLLTVDNQIDTTTGTVKVKAVFDNKDGALFPNQFVNVRLILQDRLNAIVIPATALQTGTRGNFVYVVKEGEPPARENAASTDAAPGSARTGKQNGPAHYVEAQQVKVDLTEGSQVILLEGVNAGDQIVVDGQEKLRDGSKVVPRMANAAAGNGNGGRDSSSGKQKQATNAKGNTMKKQQGTQETRP